jgi:hypothetical protein
MVYSMRALMYRYIAVARLLNASGARYYETQLRMNPQSLITCIYDLKSSEARIWRFKCADQ